MLYKTPYFTEACGSCLFWVHTRPLRVLTLVVGTFVSIYRSTNDEVSLSSSTSSAENQGEGLGDAENPAGRAGFVTCEDDTPAGQPPQPLVSGPTGMESPPQDPMVGLFLSFFFFYLSLDLETQNLAACVKCRSTAQLIHIIIFCILFFHVSVHRSTFYGSGRLVNAFQA